MIDANTTRQLVRLEDELRAQKVASSLNFGALARPGSSQVIKTSSHVGNRFNPAIGANARWLVKFQRTDGVKIPPMAQMSYDFRLAIPLYMDLIRLGQMSSLTGRDPAWTDEEVFFSDLVAIGDDYLVWKIEIGGANASFYYEMSDGTDVNLSVQVLSPVDGITTMERVG